MKCPSCGNEVHDDAKFCTSCGQPLPEEIETPTESLDESVNASDDTPEAEPTAEPTPEADSEPTTEPTPEADSEPAGEPTAEPTPEADSEPTPEPTPEADSEPTPVPMPEAGSVPMPEATEPKKSKKPLIIVLVVAAVIALLAIMITGFSCSFTAGVDIVGDWETAIVADNTTDEIVEVDSSLGSFNAKSDGTYSIRIDDITSSGTWEMIDDSELRDAGIDPESGSYYILDLEGDDVFACVAEIEGKDTLLVDFDSVSAGFFRA